MYSCNFSSKMNKYRNKQSSSSRLPFFFCSKYIHRKTWKSLECCSLVIIELNKKTLFSNFLWSLHVLRGVGEGKAVLWSRVLWTVWSHMAQDHHDGPVRVHLLGHTEVVDAVVGDDVCQVVLERKWMLSSRHSVRENRSDRADVRAHTAVLDQSQTDLESEPTISS